jgi:hypothetical protein
MLAISARVVWIVFRFYWLRVLSCLLLLLLWGSFAIGGPLFVTELLVSEAAYLQAIFTALLGVWLGGICFVAAHATYKWFIFQQKFAGGFWKPWNEA